MRILLLVILVIVGSLAMSGAVEARAEVPTCTVTPDPVTVGTKYTVAGSGYVSDQYLNVRVQDTHGTQVYIPPVKADGTFAVSGWASWPGIYAVSVLEYRHARMRLIATCSFTAQ